VDPDVVVISRERIPQRVASRLRIPGLPELDSLLVIQFGFLDTTRLRQLEVFTVDP